MQEKRALHYVIAGAILLLPMAAMAAILPDQLVPCTGTSASPCDTCALVTLADNILQFLIYLSVFVAVVAFTWAGFLFVTAAGNESQITKAKGTFSAVAIGFILVLASWLIIDTVLSFTKVGGVDEWVSEICAGGGAGEQPGTGGDSQPGDDQSGSPDEDTDRVFNQQESEDHLDGKVGVVASGNCTQKSNPNCTSLDGTRKSTLDGVLAIDAACPECGIVITSGTEGTTETSNGIHSNSCHRLGTCVDIDCRGTGNQCTNEQIGKIIVAASQNGRMAQYEVTDINRYLAVQEYIGAEGNEHIAAAAGGEGVALIDPDHATGEHFSLYQD